MRKRFYSLEIEYSIERARKILRVGFLCYCNESHCNVYNKPTTIEPLTFFQETLKIH
jgi:hypothetical protein